MRWSIFLSCKEAVIPVIRIILLSYRFICTLSMCIQIHTKQPIYYAAIQTSDYAGVFWVIFSSHILQLFLAVLKYARLPFPTKQGIKISLFTQNCNFKVSALYFVSSPWPYKTGDAPELCRGWQWLYFTSMPVFASLLELFTSPFVKMVWQLFIDSQLIRA